MTQDTWNAVDSYLTDTLVKPDPALEDALRASEAAGLPAINVSPPQGKFLQLLARFRSGATLDARFGNLDGLGHGILEFTHAVMYGTAD